MEKSLLTALKNVQDTVPVIKKNAKGYNYKYADLPKVWDTIKEAISKQGFVVTHEITADGVRTTAIHEGGELHSTIPFTVEGMKPQEIGSEITYYKRYNLGAIFNLIIEGEDDDAQVAQGKAVIPKAGNCPQCGEVLTIKKDKSGSYCKNRYGTSPSCPPKPIDPRDKAIEAELDGIPIINSKQ